MKNKNLGGELLLSTTSDPHELISLRWNYSEPQCQNLTIWCGVLAVVCLYAVSGVGLQNPSPVITEW